MVLRLVLFTFGVFLIPQTFHVRGEDIPSQNRVSRMENRIDHKHKTEDEAIDHLYDILDQIDDCPASKRLAERFAHLSKYLGELQGCINYFKEMDRSGSVYTIIAEFIDASISGAQPFYEGEILSFPPEEIQYKVTAVSRLINHNYRLLHNFSYKVPVKDFPDFWARRLFKGIECVRCNDSASERSDRIPPEPCVVSN